MAMEHDVYRYNLWQNMCTVGMWMVIRGPGDTLPRRERFLTTASIYGKFMETKTLFYFISAQQRAVTFWGSGSGTISPKGSNSKEIGGHRAKSEKEVAVLDLSHQ